MSEAVKQVTLTIDGQTVQVPADSTILDAANKLGIEIPTLCYDSRLRSFGACRMCLVAVKQMRGRLTTACSTPVSEGMEVTTSNEMIDRVRHTVLELLLVHHPLDCPVCDKAGECKLQDYAYRYGAAQNRLDGFQTKHDLPPETRSPLVERVPNRCILCGLCTRVCDEVQCVGEIAFVRRGFGAGISTLFDRPLQCQFCGQCIDICPVGALLAKPFKHKARVWELERTPSICPWCGVGCRVVYEHKRDKVYRVRAETGLGVNLGNLCGKGRYGFGYLQSDERLTQPLVRQDGALTPVSWNEALDKAASLVREAMYAAGPRATGLIAGPRATNEALWLARELFVDKLQTPNVGGQQEDLAAPLLQGVAQVLGDATGATMADVFTADALLVVANDGVDSTPVLGNRVIARSREDGVALTVIDSRRSAQMKSAQYPLRCSARGSADTLAIFLATIIDEGLGKGRHDVVAARKALGNPEKLAARTGLELETIRQAARAFAKTKNKLIILGAHPYDRAVTRRMAVTAADLALLTGAKLLPVVEKGNLRGATALGLLPGEGGLGYDAMLRAAGESVRAIVVLGDDPYTHVPDGRETRAGLDKLDGLIVSDLYLSETARRADVVFPAAAMAEQRGTVTNTEGRVQALARAVQPPGEAWPDWRIVMELGRRLDHEHGLTGVDELFAAMAAACPWVGERMPVGGEASPLPPASDEGVLVAPEVVDETPPEQEYPLSLLTGPLLWHSGTTSMRSQHLEEVYQGPNVRINEEDAEQMGVASGDRVRLIGPNWSVEAVADVGDFAAPGSVFLPNHHSDAPAAGFFRDGKAAVRLEKVTS